MIGYYNIFKDRKTMEVICYDKELFKKYKEIWEKYRSKIGKEFIKEPTYQSNKYKYANTKIGKFGGVIRIFINIKYQKHQKKNFHINVCH